MGQAPLATFVVKHATGNRPTGLPYDNSRTKALGVVYREATGNEVTIFTLYSQMIVLTMSKSDQSRPMVEKNDTARRQQYQKEEERTVVTGNQSMIVVVTRDT